MSDPDDEFEAGVSCGLWLGMALAGGFFLVSLFDWPGKPSRLWQFLGAVVMIAYGFYRYSEAQEKRDQRVMNRDTG